MSVDDTFPVVLGEHVETCVAPVLPWDIYEPVPHKTVAPKVWAHVRPHNELGYPGQIDHGEHFFEHHGDEERRVIKDGRQEREPLQRAAAPE